MSDQDKQPGETKPKTVRLKRHETPAALKALDDALRASVEKLLGERSPEGHWKGELSKSALATATAVTALALVSRSAHERRIDAGIRWLADHQNEDGGWGDTTRSSSNISTTVLAWSAFAAARADTAHPQVLQAAESWIVRTAGGLGPPVIAQAIEKRYGNDRTFSAPILAMAALSGRLGEGGRGWQHVLPLPFELAAFPQRFFRLLRLPVVSYALPALIAIGQVRHRHLPPRGAFRRMVRNLVKQKTLRVLEDIQPSSGGFLEATPLTSFVTMSLAGMDLGAHPVARKGASFLVDSQHPDGSWSIDTNLATWLTTLVVESLAAAGPLDETLPERSRRRLINWLLGQQGKEPHPYTGAAPGGWAWTDLPGGVPDADDTAGALVALERLAADEKGAEAAARAGARWLLGLQNRDGGMPTFCQGWGTLPFDRSAPDLTAHALSAWTAWREKLPDDAARLAQAMQRALSYLDASCREDGSWVPLWFGNQSVKEEENPLYGTSRVVVGLTDAALRLPEGSPERKQALAGVARGSTWLLSRQKADGSWGGDADAPPSVEETALAVEALSAVHGLVASASRPEPQGEALPSAPRVRAAVGRGAAWLVEVTQGGRDFLPSPIGLYFAKLWYFEPLYPLIFTVRALGRARKVLAAEDREEIRPDTPAAPS